MSIPSSRLHPVLRQLAASKPVRLRISGICMEPTIPDGALVSVARKRFYWPGDVLVFTSADGHLTAHRLVGACRWRGCFRLFTRADNARNLDQGIPPSDVIGRVVGGECMRCVARVPLAHRFEPLRFFLRFGLKYLVKRATRR